jgi:hypothetical protein
MLRPKRLREKPPGKVYMRGLRCRELLAEFCASRDVLLEDMVGHDRDQFLVEARRDFCNVAKEAGFGPILTGKALHRSHWTVQYHTKPAMRARKKAFNTARRAAKAALCQAFNPRATEDIPCQL